MGIEWTFENDMATIQCPYQECGCKLKHGYLQEHGVLKYRCNVHMADEEYRYEGSVENIQKLHDDEIRRKKESFILQREGYACQEHMVFNRETQQWEMHYDPYHCGLKGCSGYCPVLGRDLDRKKGNVFYDVKTRYLRSDLEGTLFEGQVDTSVIKGRKLFGHPVSMDICRVCAELCKDKIHEKEKSRYFRELFFSEYHGKEFSFETGNIRAECRETRDLLQDLEDIRNGIQIAHASDVERKQSEDKRERKQKLHEAAVKKLENKLLETGYYNMEEFSADRRHADKWLGKERIGQLESLRQQREEEKKSQPVQLSLFDMTGEKIYEAGK
ncbi:MAG: hypothetical protein NC331_08300 [Lachnospiraceae bacterium]|nr:hypothetical protein [Lachnospiraceae bacterium]MCM1239372.1 hypothetical protein [Lachnospiraceae bacterium]